LHAQAFSETFWLQGQTKF